MIQPAAGIHILIIYEDREYELDTYPGEYRNLMMLIFDRIYTESFGECRGMGRCGTCRVEIESPGQEPDALDRNEKTSIGRLHASGNNARLACQLLITPALHNARVTVLRENQ